MFTIAIPIYKYKPEFEQVLKSIDKLDLKYIDEILCFIQPSDDTNKIINSIKKIKSNIRYEVNDTNIGMVENWNKCIKSCKSKYLIINHDDDVLMPNILTIYSKILRRYPEVAILACKTILSNNSFIKKAVKKFINILPNRINYYNINDIKNYVLNDFSIPCSGVVFNLGLLGTNYIFSNQFPYSPDEELWPRILKEYPVIILQKFLFVRNIIDGNNYEFETWFDDNFIKQYVDIRKTIIQYADYDNEVISNLKSKLINSFNAVEKHTNKIIDRNYYLNEYLDRDN